MRRPLAPLAPLALLALLALPSCLGATLEYAEPPSDAETGAGPDPADASADAEAPPITGDVPVEDDGPASGDPPATPLAADVLDAVQRQAEGLGLEVGRADPNGRWVTLEVFFDTNSATLQPASVPSLERARQLLEDHPRITTAQIAVHSDARGSAQYNLRLTAARAFAVARWLVDHGVACDRLDAVGYGESQPIDPNVTAGGFARNRRVELWILGVDGSAVLRTGGAVFGDPCDATLDPNG